MFKFNLENPFSQSKKNEEEKKEDELLVNSSDNFQEFYDQELEVDNEPGGQMGDLMEKYELEDWELKDRAKECLKYYRGNRKEPFNDQEKIKEILNWYLEYLPSENEYGLALSEEELNLLEEKEKEDLADFYKKRIDLNFEVANLNNRIKEIANTIREGQESETYSTKISDAKDELYKLKTEAKNLYNEIQANSKNIYNLEKKAFADPVEVKREKENKEEKEYQVEKEKKPDYSEIEKKLHGEVLDYLKRDGKKKEVPEYKGAKLSQEQIEKTAKEGAIEKIKSGEMLQATFFVEDFKGKRQLAYVENFFDKKSQKMKRIKYIFADDKLPAGNYGFKINPATMFVSKNNPDSAMVHIDLMVNLDKKSKVDKKTA